MLRRPITQEERKQWSTLGHLLTLEAIGEVSEWTRADYAFHGGTSLHLSWNSPRFSEDLDFLLDESASKRLAGIMRRVEQRMQERLMLIDPAITVRIGDKSRGRLADYRVTLSKDDVIGSVMLKTEFWKVDPAYLKGYRSVSRIPGVPPDLLGGYDLTVSAVLPVATLTASYLDKLTALATRPHLKWRDLFDFWWVTNHARFAPPENIPDALLRNLSAYRTVDDLPPADALRAFTVRQTKEDMLAAAEKDLQPFLPPTMWKRFWPDTVREMIDTTVAGALEVAEMLERYRPNDEPEPESEMADGPRG